ncbi:MAG: DUF2283 domain-containing protein [Cyanobacteria bacterium CRU_2_1]|nr:DUF2283 domain-containing protein [Cyanobacteria bacterium CRU_2_1]
MKVIYDVANDTLQIIFKEVPVEDFSEDRPGLMVNYDTEDQMIALKIRDASKLIENPRSLEHIVLD